MNFSIKAKILDKGYNLSALSDGGVLALQMQVGSLAKGAKNEWVRLAQHRLKTSREIYINGLQQAGSFAIKSAGDTTTYEISLIGDMPNNFEFGMPEFDMKSVRPGWLGGGKAKTAADGSKYVTIPFRHSTGTNSRFGYTGKAAAVDPDLKGQLKQAVRQYGLDRMIRAGSGQVVEGAVSRIPNNAPVHPYLQGLTRVQKGMSGSTAAGQRGSSTLTTWRVMSEKSAPEKWIHPGLRPAGLLREVESWVDSQMGRIVEDVFGRE